MNDADRLAKLEAQLAALILRDERRESEHRSLLNAYSEMAASRDAMRRDLEEDYELLGKAFDERVSGLAKRIASLGGDDQTLATLLPEFAKDMVEFVNRALDHQEVRILSHVADWFKKLFATQGRLDAIAARPHPIQEV